MRYPVVLALGVFVVGCSDQQASDAELAAFDPPIVRLRTEVEPQARARFALFDQDADGFVGANDFPRNGAARVARLDADKDGRVSEAEFTAAALKRFDRADTNKDGQATSAESAALRNAN